MESAACGNCGTGGFVAFASWYSNYLLRVMPQKRPFPRICIALGLPDTSALLDHARQEADSGETFLEFRLDHLDHPEHGVKVIREFLKQHPECIILATCRRHQNHGKFNGSVEQQLNILDLAVSAGAQA